MDKHIYFLFCPVNDHIAPPLHSTFLHPRSAECIEALYDRESRSGGNLFSQQSSWKNSDGSSRRNPVGKKLAFDGIARHVEVIGRDPIPEWNMKAGDLKRIPQYYWAIQPFYETLHGKHERDVYTDCH